VLSAPLAFYLYLLISSDVVPGTVMGARSLLEFSAKALSLSFSAPRGVHGTRTICGRDVGACAWVDLFFAFFSHLYFGAL
jgi:hypothetical protein